MEWKLTNQTRPELLTVEEASDFLRCSRDAIYDACRRGEMPSIRIGRLIRIPYSQVLQQATSSLLQTGKTEDPSSVSKTNDEAV
jgi:excisionase family DNA binding protein